MDWSEQKGKKEGKVIFFLQNILLKEKEKENEREKWKKQNNKYTQSFSMPRSKDSRYSIRLRFEMIYFFLFWWRKTREKKKTYKRTK